MARIQLNAGAEVDLAERSDLAQLHRHIDHLRHPESTDIDVTVELAAAAFTDKPIWRCPVGMTAYLHRLTTSSVGYNPGNPGGNGWAAFHLDDWNYGATRLVDMLGSSQAGGSLVLTQGPTTAGNQLLYTVPRTIAVKAISAIYTASATAGTRYLVLRFYDPSGNLLGSTTEIQSTVVSASYNLFWTTNMTPAQTQAVWDFQAQFPAGLVLAPGSIIENYYPGQLAGDQWNSLTVVGDGSSSSGLDLGPVVPAVKTWGSGGAKTVKSGQLLAVSGDFSNLDSPVRVDAQLRLIQGVPKGSNR